MKEDTPEDTLEDTVPNFVIKSTKSIALVSAVILAPFVVINIYKEQYLLALSIFFLIYLYSIAAYRCHHNKYTLPLSLFGIAPVITLTSAFALYKLGIAGSFWSFPAIFVLYFVLPLRFAAAINFVFLVCILPISLNAMAIQEFTRFYMVLIGTSGFVFMCIKEIESQQHSLTKLSNTDVLTGLNNRSLLDQSLEQAIHLNRKYKTSMTLLMVDLDHFKKVNDIFGHATGDDVLKQVSILMRNNFRAPDIIFRIGGEEFLVLLNGSDTSNSEMVAERLRQSIEAYEFLPNHKVTASIGVCELKAHNTPKDWMSQCDERLYVAKMNGRNNVVCA
jgi:diguanylate cyclase (GGDEF)-like protein